MPKHYEILKCNLKMFYIFSLSHVNVQIEETVNMCLEQENSPEIYSENFKLNSQYKNDLSFYLFKR